MKRLIIMGCICLLAGCSAKFPGTSVTGRDLVKAVNEDRRAITRLSESMAELIKRVNELAPPTKEPNK